MEKFVLFSCFFLDDFQPSACSTFLICAILYLTDNCIAAEKNTFLLFKMIQSFNILHYYWLELKFCIGEWKRFYFLNSDKQLINNDYHKINSNFTVTPFI